MTSMTDVATRADLTLMKTRCCQQAGASCKAVLRCSSGGGGNDPTHEYTASGVEIFDQHRFIWVVAAVLAAHE